MAKINLTNEEVAHVAKLARLKLTDEEIEKFKVQLSEVVNYVRELDEVDTSSLVPTSQSIKMKNITRIDATDPSRTLTQKAAIAGSKRVENAYFKVPILLKKRSIKR
ncbi:Asp-tRNA(Asn)/Glu-tRNA(Gln) amidotransferase subunit GatC [Candidatus Woesebacteria bacterium]|nr:MAG: Asp-tRNA(Asn)/Glu-tRNA(Gln) amidotransferase subunit GatC [Candidatus Woesebacteria bacterium]